MTREATEKSVEVTYSASDILALNLLTWRFWLSVVAIFATIVIVLPLIFSMIDGYSLTSSVRSMDWSFTAYMILILVAWLIVVTIVAYWLRRKRGLHGPMRFWLTDEGVAVRNRQMDLVVFWTTIKSIKLTGSRIFLFITLRSALIVPRRAFGGDADFEAFAAAAKRRWTERTQA
jgi:hypothetical protein